MGTLMEHLIKGGHSDRETCCVKCSDEKPGAGGILMVHSEGDTRCNEAL